MVWSACNQLLGKILCTSAGNYSVDGQIPLVPIFATSQWREMNLRVRDMLSFLLSPKCSTKYWSFGLFDPWSMLSSVHLQYDVPSLLFSPQEWKEWSREFSKHFNVIRPPLFAKTTHLPHPVFVKMQSIKCNLVGNQQVRIGLKITLAHTRNPVCILQELLVSSNAPPVIC